MSHCQPDVIYSILPSSLDRGIQITSMEATEQGLSVSANVCAYVSACEPCLFRLFVCMHPSDKQAACVCTALAWVLHQVKAEKAAWCRLLTFPETKLSIQGEAVKALWSCSAPLLFHEACFCFNLSVHCDPRARSFLLDLTIKAQDIKGWY